MCSVSQEGSTTASPQGNRTGTRSLLKGGKRNTHKLFLKTAVTQHLCPTQNQYLPGYFCLLFRKEASYLFSHQFLHSPLVRKLLLLHPTAPSFPSQLMKVQFWRSQGCFLPLFFQLKHVLPAADSCTPAHELRTWVIRMSCIFSDYSWCHVGSFPILSGLLTFSNHTTGPFSHALIWTEPQISALTEANQSAMPT